MQGIDERDDLDLIRVRLPLKLDIAAALTKAIGVMWPEAVMLTDGLGGDLVAGIPKDAKARAAKRPLAAVAQQARDSEPGTVTGIEPNGMTVAMEPSEAIHALADWAYTALSATDGAANYVEQEAWADLGGESRRLVVIAAWSPEQTPARLREEAERRARELEAQLAAAHQRIRELEGDTETAPDQTAHPTTQGE